MQTAEMGGAQPVSGRGCRQAAGVTVTVWPEGLELGDELAGAAIGAKRLAK